MHFIAQFKSMQTKCRIECGHVGVVIEMFTLSADAKEPEMQIGKPTDVKHVAHIGWDNASVTAPSWVTASIPPPITPFPIELLHARPISN